MDNIQEQSKIITVTDEDGLEQNLKIVEIATVNDKDYAILIPADQDEDDDEAEHVLLRLRQDNENYIFETIEDDEEFDTVVQALSDDECDDEECECHHH